MSLVRAGWQEQINAPASSGENRHCQIQSQVRVLGSQYNRSDGGVPAPAPNRAGFQPDPGPGAIWMGRLRSQGGGDTRLPAPAWRNGSSGRGAGVRGIPIYPNGIDGPARTELARYEEGPSRRG